MVSRDGTGRGSQWAGVPLHLETGDQAGLISGDVTEAPPARTCSGHCDDFRAEDKEA